MVNVIIHAAVAKWVTVVAELVKNEPDCQGCGRHRPTTLR